jgi:excisionase family DNA binding protein
LSDLAGLVSKLQAMANGPSKDATVTAAIDRLNSPLGPQWINHDAFTIEEAAEILKLSKNSAYAAAARGDIPTIRIGHRLVVPRRPLERMLGADAKA